MFVFAILVRCGKTGQIHVPEKRAPTKVQYFLQNLPNVTEFHRTKREKTNCQFAFCTHVDVIKYRNTLTFPSQITLSFRPQRKGDRKGRHIRGEQSQGLVPATGPLKSLQEGTGHRDLSHAHEAF